MTVLNVASSSKGLDELIFYIIPAAWYRKAWRLLLRPLQVETIPADWREQIGELPPVKAWWNGEHDGGNGGENHRDDDGKNDKDQTQKKGVVLNELRSAWKQDKTTNGKTVNKTHEKDFYFLGEHAWTVVKGKFGNASEEGVPCHVVSFPSKDSRLAVLLPGGAGHRIPIPPSGRFAYEESLSKEDEEMEDVSTRSPKFVFCWSLVKEEDTHISVSFVLGCCQHCRGRRRKYGNEQQRPRRAHPNVAPFHNTAVTGTRPPWQPCHGYPNLASIRLWPCEFGKYLFHEFYDSMSRSYAPSAKVFPIRELYG